MRMVQPSFLVSRLPETADPQLEDHIENDDRVEACGPRIRCPLCGWSPRKHVPVEIIPAKPNTIPGSA
jgi:hypothetical protein